MIGSWRSHVVMSRTNQLVSLDVATGRHVQLDLESERPRMTDDLVIALETTPDGRSFLSSFTPGLELRARVELLPVPGLPEFRPGDDLGVGGERDHPRRDRVGRPADE